MCAIDWAQRQQKSFTKYPSIVSVLLMTVQGLRGSVSTHVYHTVLPVTSILLNIMFHASMGRFQLELIYYFMYYFAL